MSSVLVDPGGRPAIPYLTVTYSDWNANSEDLSVSQIKVLVVATRYHTQKL